MYDYMPIDSHGEPGAGSFSFERPEENHIDTLINVKGLNGESNGGKAVGAIDMIVLSPLDASAESAQPHVKVFDGRTGALQPANSAFTEMEYQPMNFGDTMPTSPSIGLTSEVPTSGLLVPAVQKIREAAARVEATDGINDLSAGDTQSAILIGLLLPAVQKVR